MSNRLDGTVSLMPPNPLIQRAVRLCLLGVLLAGAVALYLNRSAPEPRRPPASADSPATLTRELGPLLDARLDSRQDSPPPSFDPAIAPPFQLPDAYRVSPQGLAAYQALIRQAREESIRTGRPVLVIDKAAHELDLYRAGEVEATWPVELGHNPVDDKLMEGDRATPEGRYVVEQFKDVGQTRFYRALLLNYPNADDLARFRELQKAGEIPDSATPGSLIEIHGHGSGLGIHGYDWTLGCIALSDADMDELINAGAGKGTVVFIVRYGARHDYTLSGQ